MKKIFFFFFIFTFQSAYSQITPEWISYYNNYPDTIYRINDMKLDPAGNVFVYGYAEVHDTMGSTYQSLLIKYNPQGVILWVNQYPGIWAYGKMLIDKESNIYITTGKGNPGTGNDYYTFKMDSVGYVNWSSTYNGSLNRFDEPEAISLDDSLNVYVTGSINSPDNENICTIKYDSSGNEIWIAIEGDQHPWSDNGYALTIDSLHNVYVTGRSPDSTGSAVTIKYDLHGNKIWEKRFNGIGSTGMFIQLYSNQILYVGGIIGTSTEYSYWLIQYDSSGQELWSVTYNPEDPPQHDCMPVDMKVLVNGDVVMTGTQYFHNGDDDDFATVKFDRYGDQLWLRTYQYQPGADDPRRILTDESGNIYVAGESHIQQYGDVVTLIKYDGNGTQNWAVNHYNHFDYSNYSVEALCRDSAGNIYIAGNYFNQQYQLYVLKYSYTIGIAENDFSVSNIFPNPFHASARLEIRNEKATHGRGVLKIYNPIGMLLREEEMPNINSYILHRDGLCDGLYFYELQATNSELIGTGKFIIN